MDAWDPEEFRALGHRVIDRLGDHLASCSQSERINPATTEEDFVALIRAVQS